MKNPSLGLPIPAPTLGGSWLGYPVSSLGRSRPDGARWSPGVRFRFCIRSHFRGRCAVVLRSPGRHPAVYS